MQNLFHDGGFSNMGMSLRALQQYEKGLHKSCNCDDPEDGHKYD
jgi:enoyl-[acyl-carrier protein] reductase I